MKKNLRRIKNLQGVNCKPLGVVQKLLKDNLLFVFQDYKKCRKSNSFILNEMRQEYLVFTKLLKTQFAKNHEF